MIDTKMESIDKHKDVIVREDFYISYWIFTWFILYFFITKFDLPINNHYKKWIYEYLNPIFPLILLSLMCFIILIYILFLNLGVFICIKYLFSISFYKFIPVYLLRKHPFNLFYSVISFSLLFIIYLMYLKLHNENLISIYKKSLQSFHNKSKKYSNAFIFAVVITSMYILYSVYNDFYNL
jgi:hypothetical protein